MDVETTMQFILEQQAKFFAGMEEMRTRQDKFDRQLTVLGQQLEQQNQINMALGKAMLGLTDHVEELLAAQKVTDQQIRELRAAQTTTDDRLNALIGVVDGIIRRPPAA